MTKEQIETMPPGKEIDALVADKIFKAQKMSGMLVEWIKVICFQFGRWNPGDKFAETLLIRQLPEKNPYTGVDFEFVQPYDYSTRIDAAWGVVEEMKKQGFSFDCGSWENMDDGNHWAASFEHSSWATSIDAQAETMPLAICRAALLAVMKS